jgi:hypothetical protein
MPCLAALISASTGCSYVVDAVEGAIMKRASFTIHLTNVSGNTYTVDWGNVDDLDDEEFAGYEVYVSNRPNDEFAGLKVVAAPYDLDDSGAAISNSALYLRDTHSMTVTFPSEFVTAGNVYYVRVGAIGWDEADDSDKADKWTTAKSYPYDWSDSYGSAANEYYYLHKTALSQMSGGEKIQF